MTSKVLIANLALNAVGSDNTLTNLSDATPEGRLCNRHYAPVRDMLLAEHVWRFARKRVTLAPLASTPEFDWAYQFQVPSDWIRNVKLNENEDGLVEYEMEGRSILFDSNTLKLVYVYALDDPAKYPPVFIEAFSYGLARKIAYALTGSRSLMADMDALYRQKLAEAIQIDMAQSPQKPVYNSNWLGIRS